MPVRHPSHAPSGAEWGGAGPAGDSGTCWVCEQCPPRRPRAVSRAGPWGQRDLGEWGHRESRQRRPSPPRHFLAAALTQVETGSCLWFLFSTSEAESEPLVWSLNKLELKLPQRGNWERCGVSARAAAQGEERKRGGRVLLGDLGRRGTPSCDPRTQRVFKRCLMN